MQSMNKPRIDMANYLTPLRVALVGLGKIGFQNDFRQSIEPTLTHYSTLASFSNVSIIAGVDNNALFRQNFTAGTGIGTYKNIAELKDEIDMAVISASTDNHLDLVKEVIGNLKPEIIVCEKPMGLNSKEAIEIVNLAKSNSIILYVPYLRRYMPHIKMLSQKIKSRQHGKIIEVSVEYGQGLLTNGSHFVNLVDYLVGGLSAEISVISRVDPLNPSWTMTSADNAIVKFQGSSAQTRSGEIRIRCETGEYILLHGGIVTYFGSIDPMSGWLEQPCDLRITDWRLGMQNFYSYLLLNHAKDLNDISEDLESAIRTQKIITKALR